jgi:hypothetical protein
MSKRHDDECEKKPKLSLPLRQDRVTM